MWVAYIGLFVHGEAQGWHHICFSFSLPCILMWALSLEPWAPHSITVTSEPALVILWVFRGLGLQMGCYAYWYLHGCWGFEPWSPSLHGKLFAHWLTVSALVAFLFPVTKYLRRNNIGQRLCEATVCHVREALAPEAGGSWSHGSTARKQKDKFRNFLQFSSDFSPWNGASHSQGVLFLLH